LVAVDALTLPLLLTPALWWLGLLSGSDTSLCTEAGLKALLPADPADRAERADLALWAE
jgi:hypothetical protein